MIKNTPVNGTGVTSWFRRNRFGNQFRHTVVPVNSTESEREKKQEMETKRGKKGLKRNKERRLGKIQGL